MVNPPFAFTTAFAVGVTSFLLLIADTAELNADVIALFLLFPALTL